MGMCGRNQEERIVLMLSALFSPVPCHFTIFNLLTSQSFIVLHSVYFRLSCAVWNGNWKTIGSVKSWEGGIERGIRIKFKIIISVA